MTDHYSIKTTEEEKPCSVAEGLWPLALWWECRSLLQTAQVHRLWWPCGRTVNIRISLSLVKKILYRRSASHQYFLCTWLFLCRLSMCSTASSLLASRRAPVVSFSSPTQGSSWEPDLIMFPSIILERTGSTEEMEVTLLSSERQWRQQLTC